MLERNYLNFLFENEQYLEVVAEYVLNFHIWMPLNKSIFWLNKSALSIW